MSQLKLIQHQQTMSSLELVKIINELREPEQAELRHNDFMAKILKVIGVDGARKFSHTYLDSQNKERPCYTLPKRECHLMVMSESYKVQAAVYDRMAALEKPMTQVEVLVHSALLLAEHETRLLAVEERLSAIDTSIDYFTIKGYWSYRKLGNLPLAKASAAGKKASAFCKGNGVQMGEAKDPIFGTIKTYPLVALDEIFN